MPNIGDLAAVDETVADGDILPLHNISKSTNLKDQGLTITKLRADAFLGRANSWSALQTFSAGISLGNETLAVYDEGTWSPAISSSGTPPTVFYTQQAGRYTRIGNVVFYGFFIRINTISGGTGVVRVSLPLTVAAGDANASPGSIHLYGPNIAGTIVNVTTLTVSGTAALYIAGVQNNGAPQSLEVSGLANGDYLVGSGFYFV